MIALILEIMTIYFTKSSYKYSHFRCQEIWKTQIQNLYGGCRLSDSLDMCVSCLSASNPLGTEQNRDFNFKLTCLFASNCRITASKSENLFSISSIYNETKNNHIVDNQVKEKQVKVKIKQK